MGSEYHKQTISKKSAEGVFANAALQTIIWYVCGYHAETEAPRGLSLYLSTAWGIFPSYLSEKGTFLLWNQSERERNWMNVQSKTHVCDGRFLIPPHPKINITRARWGFQMNATIWPRFTELWAWTVVFKTASWCTHKSKFLIPVEFLLPEDVSTAWLRFSFFPHLHKTRMVMSRYDLRG